MAAKRVKNRIFSGCVCEQEVYSVPERTSLEKARPQKPRFASEEERRKHREGIARRNFARLLNANCTPESLYATLTFDNESEVHTFEEAKTIANRYWKAIRRACPEAKLFLVMGRGKHTSRIHFHMVSDGVPENILRGKWIYGDVVRIVPLRAHNYYGGKDYGADYTGLANYLFDHWTPEQGGHHYKATRNLTKPEREKATRALVEYTLERPPRAPKGYQLVEAQATPYGLLWFKYVRVTDSGGTAALR